MSATSGAVDRRQREYREALKRLRRLEQAARAVLERPSAESPPIMLDSERYAAPLWERLDARSRIQLLLWGAVAVATACAIVSFFTTPLMQVDQALETTLVLGMLVLSYLL